MTELNTELRRIALAIETTHPEHAQRLRRSAAEVARMERRLDEIVRDAQEDGAADRMRPIRDVIDTVMVGLDEPMSVGGSASVVFDFSQRRG